MKLNSLDLKKKIEIFKLNLIQDLYSINLKKIRSICWLIGLKNINSIIKLIFKNISMKSLRFLINFLQR